jgi:hypothetical protein
MFGFESAFKTPDKLQQEISSTSVFREKRRIIVIELLEKGLMSGCGASVEFEALF